MGLFHGERTTTTTLVGCYGLVHVPESNSALVISMPLDGRHRGQGGSAMLVEACAEKARQRWNGAIDVIVRLSEDQGSQVGFFKHQGFTVDRKDWTTIGFPGYGMKTWTMTKLLS